MSRSYQLSADVTLERIITPIEEEPGDWQNQNLPTARTSGPHHALASQRSKGVELEFKFLLTDGGNQKKKAENGPLSIVDYTVVF